MLDAAVRRRRSTSTSTCKAIKDVEHKADLLTLTMNQRIDKSFITPIDREDIHMLASRLDDVIDLLDGTARRFEMLHITEVLPPAQAADRRAAAARRTRSQVAVDGDAEAGRSSTSTSR